MSDIESYGSLINRISSFNFDRVTEDAQKEEKKIDQKVKDTWNKLSPAEQEDIKVKHRALKDRITNKILDGEIFPADNQRAQSILDRVSTATEFLQGNQPGLDIALHLEGLERELKDPTLSQAQKDEISEKIKALKEKIKEEFEPGSA